MLLSSWKSNDWKRRHGTDEWDEKLAGIRGLSPVKICWSASAARGLSWWPPHVQCSHFRLQLLGSPNPVSCIRRRTCHSSPCVFAQMTNCTNVLAVVVLSSCCPASERGSQMPFLAKEPSQQRKSSWMRFKMLLNYFKTLQLRHASPPILHSITIGATWVLAIICKCCKKVDNAGEITFFGSQPAQK